MAGRSFTRHTNGIGNRIRAEHINELQSALEEDDARIDLKTDDGQFTAHVDDTDNPHAVTKAQVGLGNVDNTSDMAKPVSTAVQAALDGKADVEDAVPAGGVYGQVLTVTHSGKQWVDPPGIVYPSLLLSPDGSFDKAGAVSPTVSGAVSVVPGKYGQAWELTHTSAGPASVQYPVAGTVADDAGTVIVRYRDVVRGDPLSRTLWLVFIQQRHLSPERELVAGFRWGLESIRYTLRPEGSAILPTTGIPPSGVFAAVWGGGRIRILVDGRVFLSGSYSVPPVAPAESGTWRFGHSWDLNPTAPNEDRVDLEGILTYQGTVPDAEIARLSNMPTAWTMQNTAVNMALQSQPPAGSPFLQMHPPNRKIGTGGATLRTAPGPSTQAITTLAAGTDVHDTKTTVSVSSVSYSLVVTAFGNAWVPTSTLV